MSLSHPTFLGTLAVLVATSLLPASARAGSALTLRTPDGRSVACQTAGKGALGVVLVSGSDEAASDWTSTLDRLGASGVRVLACDGRPAAPAADGAELTATLDLQAAIAWLRNKGATTVALVGSKDGGNIALHVAASDAGVARLAWVTPRLSVPGLSVTADLAAYGARPILLATSSGDPTSVRATGALAGKAPGADTPILVDTEGEGVRLLGRSPKLDAAIASWLREADATTEEDGSQPNTAEVGDIVTTGKKLGE